MPTKRELLREKRRIKACVRRWWKIMGLDLWEFSMSFKHVPDPADDKDFVTQSLAQNSTHWMYLLSHVRWNLPAYVDMEYTDAELERSIVHELCHTLVHEMRWVEGPGGKVEHEERVVTMLTKAFLAARRAGFDEGVRAAQQVKKKRRIRS